jgi:formylglycine-generating enzyme required for sulfatase activity
MPSSRIFISHSHHNNEFCRDFVNTLRGMGVEVWYDEQQLGSGAIRQVIEQEMVKCDRFIVIMSPSAVASDWVNAEIDAALILLRKREMKAFLPVVAELCAIPLLLERYKRIDAGCTAPEAARRAYHALFPHHQMPSPSGMRIASSTSSVTADNVEEPQLPVSLQANGFISRVIKGIKVIIPPLIEIPAGAFLMGSNRKKDRQASDNEQPQHTVPVGTYRIGRYPLTVAEYACFVRATQRHEPLISGGITWRLQTGERMDHPVVCISWQDMLAYVRWLAGVTGEPWRLPTEAEWEKAARSPDGRMYPWGNEWDTTRANTSDSGPGHTTAVGSYSNGGSPYGVQDMAGNVWEWTSTVYQEYPYIQEDGREHLASTSNRVLRGGSWGSNLRHARAAFRSDLRIDGFFDNGGGRLVVGSLSTSSSGSDC